MDHHHMPWLYGTWDNKETWEKYTAGFQGGWLAFSWFLTITSPLASKRECKANSELVPPPGNALEQHKFRRFSTVGNTEITASERAQFHGKHINAGVRIELLLFCSSHGPIPLC